MLEDTSSEAEIFKILTQIQKLKIIWYKTLKKLKMIEQYRDILKEFGIVGSNIPENNSAKATSFFKNKLVKKQDTSRADDMNNSFMNLDQMKHLQQPFNDEIDLLISTLDNQYDFLIPFDQIEMIGEDYGKWFTGLIVNLRPRKVQNRFQISQLLQEV